MTYAEKIDCVQIIPKSIGSRTEKEKKPFLFLCSPFPCTQSFMPAFYIRHFKEGMTFFPCAWSSILFSNIEYLLVVFVLLFVFLLPFYNSGILVDFFLLSYGLDFQKRLLNLTALEVCCLPWNTYRTTILVIGPPIRYLYF